MHAPMNGGQQNGLTARFRRFAALRCFVPDPAPPLLAFFVQLRTAPKKAGQQEDITAAVAMTVFRATQPVNSNMESPSVALSMHDHDPIFRRNASAALLLTA
jgi:hypothetical protein